MWHIALSTFNDYAWSYCDAMFCLSDALTLVRANYTQVPTCVWCIAAECEEV